MTTPTPGDLSARHVDVREIMRWLNGDVLQVLLDVSNGIDSPALPDMARSGIRRIEATIAALSAPAAGKDVDDGEVQDADKARIGILHTGKLGDAFPDKGPRRLALEGGKYEIVQESFGEFYALRHGERWRDLTGDKMVAALFEAALTRQPAPSDDDLPGMWSHSDFTGGDPDERSHHERTRQPVAGDGMVLTKELIDRCAQRLASWDDGCVWPHSWDARQVRAMRKDAELVLREAGFAELAAPAATPTDGGEGS